MSHIKILVTDLAKIIFQLNQSLMIESQKELFKLAA